MKKFLTLFFMLTLLFTAFSQQSNCPPTVTHLGVTYNTIWVGGNCWMRDNLRSAQYGTQSNIDLVYPGLQPTYVTYPGADPYMGYLYTWYSAVGLPEGSTANPPTAISERVQGICPNEWAIPSAAQLEALLASGESRTGNASYWAFNTGTIPSGSNGFLMVPSGFFNNQFNQFAEYNHVGYIWTLNYNGNNATCGVFPFDCRPSASMSMNKQSLLSVRCVKAPPYGIEEITACDSITWNGVTRYTTGRYVANLANDSVSTLLLTVNYTTRETVKLVECDSYYWNLTEQTYTTSGVHQATIENYLGCDSIVTLDLEVRYSNTGIDVQNHCDSYTWIDGHTYTESTNTPTFVVTNAAGCDSTVTLNLTIRKMTTGIDVQNHCDSYTWIDGITYTESTNTPTYTLTNAAGCDSIVTLNLTIRNKTYGIDVQDHCDSYTWINGITYTESTNEPVYTITNLAGCDSIVTLNLTIRKKTASPSQSLTEYNTYTWNGVTYTTSGVYTATLTNAVGCDSTATLDLTILYRFPITYNVNDGVLPAEYPVTYIQGVGATLPIPTKLNNRFDGWFDNPTFTGSPITSISNVESGDRQYYALWTVTQMGQNSSLSFSGSSSAYAQIPDSTFLNPTTAITLEAWIYPTAWRTNIYEGSIISKEIATGNGGYILRCGDGGKLSFTLGIGTAFQELATTTNVLTLNQWQHVAGTYDGTTMRIYLNGVEIGNKAQTGTINVSSNRVEIGRNYAYTSRYFTGRIDEVRIFNTALDAPTIQNWYNKSVKNTHANYANLVGYYEFDNTTNPGVTYATVGNNGTVATATYVTNCVSPFISSNVGTPSSITATHPLPTNYTAMLPLVPGDTLAQILRINVKPFMAGNLTQVTVSTNGSTNPADLSNARLWYTGTSTTFSTATPFGTPILNPNGTMTFTGSQALTCGSTYYFFLTYDVKPSATIGNVVDAEVVNCTIERLLTPATMGAPTGNRPIVDPCTYHILQIRDSYGDTWEGNIIAVKRNNDTIFSNLTITVGSSSDIINTWFNYPFFANSGDTIRIIKTTAGTSTSECKFQIVRGSSVVVSETTVATPPAINTFVAGCYNVVTASASSLGTITPSGAFNVYGNRSQTFTFTPNQYCLIDSVLINGVNDPAAVLAGSYTFSNLTSPQTIKAVFRANTITASTGSYGTISSSGVTVMAPNSSKTYTMTPNTNCWLDSLIVDGINRPDSIAGKSFTFNNVNESHTIRAVFRANVITATAGSNGTISSSGATIMALNSSKTYTVTPNTNYYVDSLIVDGINRPDSIPGKSFTFVNVNESHTIRVVFKTNIITSSAGANGTISPNGTTYLGINGTQKFTIVPNQYYYIDSLIVDGINRVDSIPASSFTFTNVNENHTIRVVFKTDYITPTLITAPTTTSIYEASKVSNSTLTGGLVQYNGTNIPGTFTWNNPDSVVASAGTSSQTVKFTPSAGMYTHITFNVGITVNALSYNVVASAGTTSTSTNIPFYGLYMDNNQQNFILYPDSMITPLNGKTIRQITFYTTTPASGLYNSTVTIKLGPTSINEIPSTGTVTYTPTTVYTGKISIVGNLVIISLNTPYTHTSGNLILEFNSVASNYISATFTGVTRTNTSRRTYGTSTTSRYSFIPKTKFSYLP